MARDAHGRTGAVGWVCTSSTGEGTGHDKGQTGWAELLPGWGRCGRVAARQPRAPRRGGRKERSETRASKDMQVLSSDHTIIITQPRHRPIHPTTLLVARPCPSTTTTGQPSPGPASLTRPPHSTRPRPRPPTHTRLHPALTSLTSTLTLPPPPPLRPALPPSRWARLCPRVRDCNSCPTRATSRHPNLHPLTRIRRASPSSTDQPRRRSRPRPARPPRLACPTRTATDSHSHTPPPTPTRPPQASSAACSALSAQAAHSRPRSGPSPCESRRQSNTRPRPRISLNSSPRPPRPRPSDSATRSPRSRPSSDQHLAASLQAPRPLRAPPPRRRRPVAARSRPRVRRSPARRPTARLSREARIGRSMPRTSPRSTSTSSSSR